MSAPASALPLFRLMAGPSPTAAAPLGIVSGLLLYDSGEAEETFLYRCQDRYLAYNSLAGIRTVLFVANEEHSLRYRHLIKRHNERIRMVSAHTGVPLPIAPEPWFAAVDLSRLDPIELPNAYTLVLNQVSPTCARLAGEQLRSMGELALRWHDKAHYFRTIERQPEGLPPHAHTALFSTSEFAAVASWRDLAALWAQRTGRPEPAALYVKSSYDSGGNASARLSSTGFEDTMGRARSLSTGPELSQLRVDIESTPSLAHMCFSDLQLAGWLRAQRRRRGQISILVQEAIEGPEDADVQGLGVTCWVESPERAEIVVAAGQLYRDTRRHHFSGSFLSDDPLPGPLAAQILRLCSMLAREGYQGPVNFDARRNAANEWVFLYDCNPRLSAVYPPLAVRAFLRSCGYDVRTIASLGYRGEFARANLEGMLLDLDAAGLLYQSRRGWGILPIPNMARDHGLDLLLLNIPVNQIGSVANRSRAVSDLDFRVY
ncbi:MAG: hypothetical protein LAQ69_16640 [Acidobacteriia bacterium]|nr:hypothetical protein [Terriglobia bacterium]